MATVRVKANTMHRQRELHASNPRRAVEVNHRSRFGDASNTRASAPLLRIAIAAAAIATAGVGRSAQASIVMAKDDAKDEAPPAQPVFQPPRLIHFVEAAPPEMGARLEAEVVLTIDIDETGKVTSVAVAKSAGGEGGEALDQAAVEAARQFVFEPGRADGRPVPVRITYSYKFVLKPPPAPAPPVAAAPGSAAGPTVPVSGIVRRRGDRTPVAGVAVIATIAPGDERREVTDAEGRFSFEGLPVGDRTLELRGTNIAPTTAAVSLHEGKALELTTFVDVKERFASTVRGKRAVVETVE